jgi:hypothetical protein
MRRTVTTAASVLCVCAVLAGAAGIASAGSGLSGPEKITVTGRPSQFNEVDNEPEGDSIGDLFAFSGSIFRGKAAAGHFDATCTLTHKYRTGGDRHECALSVTLSGGQVQANGNIRLFSGSNAFDIPLVGGSGRFQNVGGFVHVADIPGNAQRIVLHLIVP